MEIVVGARSSARQSGGLQTRRSGVRVPPGPPHPEAQRVIAAPTKLIILGN